MSCAGVDKSSQCIKGFSIMRAREGRGPLLFLSPPQSKKSFPCIQATTMTTSPLTVRLVCSATPSPCLAASSTLTVRLVCSASYGNNPNVDEVDLEFLTMHKINHSLGQRHDDGVWRLCTPWGMRRGLHPQKKYTRVFHIKKRA